jgi:hypothetical protein
MTEKPAPSRRPTVAEVQAAVIAESRAESRLDRRIPLGYPSVPPRPEIGLSATEFYRLKHLRGEPGIHWPLHQCAPAVWER